MNEVYIDQFPELNGLLSSDSLVLFKKEGSGYAPIVIAIADLSAFFVSKAEMSSIIEVEEQLEKKIESVSEFLEKTLPIDADLNAYVTRDQYAADMKKLETKEAFKQKLDGKATLEYLEYQYKNLLAKLQVLKMRLSSGDRWEVAKGVYGYPYKTVLDTLAGQSAGWEPKDYTWDGEKSEEE